MGVSYQNPLLALKKNNDLLISYFRNLPERSEVIINPDLNSILMKGCRSGADERYLEDYVFMAKKGFYSFDKTNPNHFTHPEYHLVASPKNPLKLEDLPENILHILKKTTYHIDLEKSQCNCIIEII